MRTTITAAAVLVAGVCATLVAGPAHAAGSGPSCGDTLTQDTVLTHDLTCTSGDGLRLAPGVTLDLGGKVLEGSYGGSGVVAPPSGDVTVTNGVIAGWVTGLTADDGYDPETGDWAELGGTVHADRLVLRDNGTAIEGTGRTDGQRKVFAVDRSTVRDNPAGFSTTGGYATFHRTTMRDNAVALYVNTGGVAVTRSVLRDNELAFVGGGGSGITVTSSAVLDNRIGFQAWFMDSVEITRSEIRGHETALAIAADAARTSVHDTTLTDNDVAIDVVQNVDVRGSTFRRNGVAVRVAEDSGSGPVTDPTSQVTDSTFADGGDGLVSTLAGLRVGGNTATGNTGRGIHAPGAQDLGGNTASGNGTEPQCIGVACTPGG